MNRKEVLDLLLSRIAEDKKDDLIRDLRNATTRAEKLEAIKKYGIELSEEEIAALKSKDGNEISDEELDSASGGCTLYACNCGCY